LYPREGVVGMWAAIGIALRVSVERENLELTENDSDSDEQADEAEEFKEPNFAHTSRVMEAGA
jgi:hypothetical protein